MQIGLVKKHGIGNTPFFILKEGSPIEKHPLFSTVSENDQHFLHAFLKKSPLKEGHTHFIFLPSGNEAFLVGVSVRQKFTHRKAMLTIRKVVASARKEKVKRITVSLDDFITLSKPRITEEQVLEVMTTHALMANFEFTRYKTPPKNGWPFVEELSIYIRHLTASLGKAVLRGKILGEEINKARELSNTPGMDMTPEHLGKIAVAAGKELGFSVKILNEKEMQKLGMGGVLGVGQGSDHKPCFIVMEYLKGKKSEKPIVLVGKGVTFDSGGLNLKPEQGLLEMHMDMSGGAVVLHAMKTLARLGIKKNVIGLIPAVENMVSGSSYHPGDVLRTMSGKTIEILNTDAEGRVILADGITYAKQYDPSLIIDVATLTGAALSALGQRASALFTTHPDLEERLRALGEQTGDFVWPLPLWEEYEDEIKGSFGDIANVSKTRYGGAIIGAVFLWQFLKHESSAEHTLPAWVHLDIVPRMTSVDGEFLAKGAMAPGIALLTYFLRAF